MMFVQKACLSFKAKTSFSHYRLVCLSKWVYISVPAEEIPQSSLGLGDCDYFTLNHTTLKLCILLFVEGGIK